MKTLLTLTLALLTSNALNAQEMPLKAISGSELGLIVSNYTYEEDNNGSFLMSLQGRKFGAAGAFVQSLADHWFWSIDGRFVSGNVDYKSAGSGEKSANTDAYAEVRLTAGRDLEVGHQVLAPYAGLGYRHLNNDLRGHTSTGSMGYRRTSSYVYLPVGVQHRMRAGSAARFVTSLEYDYLIEGIQRSYITDAVGGAYTYTSDLTNLQRSGHGLRLGLAYESRHWSVTVFHHHWDIATSDQGVYTSTSLVHTAIEPHNISRETGVILKYHFR